MIKSGFELFSRFLDVSTICLKLERNALHLSIKMSSIKIFCKIHIIFDLSLMPSVYLFTIFQSLFNVLFHLLPVIADALYVPYRFSDFLIFDYLEVITAYLFINGHQFLLAFSYLFHKFGLRIILLSQLSQEMFLISFSSELQIRHILLGPLKTPASCIW